MMETAGPIRTRRSLNNGENPGSPSRTKKATRAAPSVSRAEWKIEPAELQFTDKLGAGATARVYKGRYRGKEVAIKILKTKVGDDGCMDAKVARDFEHECEIMSKVSSPYIVPFVGACLEPQVSIVVSYCSHGCLSSAMEDDTFNIGWDLVFKWASQMVQAILTLHSFNPPIFHRDLKSPNLLLNSQWDIQVCDFGNARGDDVGDASTLNKMRGTYAWCAPELFFGSKFTTKADVYSVGVILWELVVRCTEGKYYRPYHEHPNLTLGYTIILKTAKNGLRPSFTQGVPAEWRELIQRCWDPRPESRPETAEIMQEITRLQNLYSQTKKAEWDALVPPSVLSSATTTTTTTTTTTSSADESVGDEAQLNAMTTTEDKRSYLIRTQSKRVPLSHSDTVDLKGFLNIRYVNKEK
eukprot:TRINITY_DN4699_c0_g2_i1.p1 TRINITY_DN4699_c0_g2~~TRINITY_DN4699_c0_g2_i1.p1  ORF type:complete len:411 (+),score=75.33 TRINITY_DN4699_c0_g2_i1:378-1610(+)